jgi:hypothetical protein
MPFVQMVAFHSSIQLTRKENISCYLNACSSLGLATHDLFQTVDLYEEKNMNQVNLKCTQYLILKLGCN